MASDNRDLTIQDLSDRTGTPVRTIRFYVTERLLPGPEGRGTATSYTEDHLLRLRLIRALTGRHVPLAAIRARLERIPDAELAKVLSDEEQMAAAESVAEASSPREYISTLLNRAREAKQENAPSLNRMQASRLESEEWRRVKIADGVELHYTAQAESDDAQGIRQIVDAARQITGNAGRRDKQ